MDKRICFIMPYFGKLPYNFNLWLNFCRHNKNFNWLFFTDDKTPYSFPKNVSVNYVSLSELKDYIQNKIGKKISLEFAYKLCDYRPLYGFIFSDYLTNYDFWGYGDLDTIIGDLSSFITNDRLDEYDKISLMGHLSILRNNDLVNKAYEDCDYLSIIKNKNNINFDEIRYDVNINNLLKNRGCKILEDFEKYDICYEHFCFYNYEYVGKKRVEIVERTASIFEYDNGKLFQINLKNDIINRKEIAYVHYKKRIVRIPDTLDVNNFIFAPDYLSSNYTINEDFITNNTKDNYLRLINCELERIKESIKRRIRIGQ